MPMTQLVIYQNFFEPVLNVPDKPSAKILNCKMEKFVVFGFDASLSPFSSFSFSFSFSLSSDAFILIQFR